jgi:hypothetical protein
MIYILPIEGLANRIRAIASAISLAEDLHQEVFVVWKKDNTLNAEFDHLFQKNVNFKVKKYNYYYRIFFYSGNSKIMIFVRQFIHKYFKIDFFITDKDIPELVWKNNDNLDLSKLQMGRNKIRNIALFTCHKFYNIDKSISKLIPNEFIVLKSKSYIFDFNNIIGIHIRRTDNFNSILHSPLELFIINIKSEISKNPNVKFYLATDDYDTFESLQKLFSDKIIYFKKNYERSKYESIIDAFVDLYSLSLCSKIYGSYSSSFSEIASFYDNTPLLILKK